MSDVWGGGALFVMSMPIIMSMDDQIPQYQFPSVHQQGAVFDQVICVHKYMELSHARGFAVNLIHAVVSWSEGVCLTSIDFLGPLAPFTSQYDQYHHLKTVTDTRFSLCIYTVKHRQCHMISLKINLNMGCGGGATAVVLIKPE